MGEWGASLGASFIPCSPPRPVCPTKRGAEAHRGEGTGQVHPGLLPVWPLLLSCDLPLCPGSRHWRNRKDRDVLLFSFWKDMQTPGVFLEARDQNGQLLGSPLAGKFLSHLLQQGKIGTPERPHPQTLDTSGTLERLSRGITWPRLRA
jgi:hypothetical protein